MANKEKDKKKLELIKEILRKRGIKGLFKGN